MRLKQPYSLSTWFEGQIEGILTSNRAFPVVIELILNETEDETGKEVSGQSWAVEDVRYLDFPTADSPVEWKRLGPVNTEMKREAPSTEKNEFEGQWLRHGKDGGEDGGEK